MIPTIHPFPARMAPELALNTLKELKTGSLVLDPMSGSGMVLRQAAELGFNSIGFDMDPLAVLMSMVWTTHVEDSVIEFIYKKCLGIALSTNPNLVHLPWIDEDRQTSDFIAYWFAPQQIKDLRCWAFAIITLFNQLKSDEELAALNVIKIALSRIIITKEQCASLARDTSHSRPHRVSLSSDYNIFAGIDRSLITLRKRLSSSTPKAKSNISIGDARAINLENNSVDAVLTSPPYLNAIDYMRGHRMSLVWLGYKIDELRTIRSSSIGAERAPDHAIEFSEIMTAFGDLSTLPKRHSAMIARYSKDIAMMTSEISRVLKPGGKATFVMGNSCLKGVFINNSHAVEIATQAAGLRIIEKFERDLPTSNRYLPIGDGSALQNRMRTETIITAMHP